MPLFVEGIHGSISLESNLKCKPLVSPLLEVTQYMATGMVRNQEHGDGMEETEQEWEQN